MTATAKVFTAGNSQAVRLPKAFRVEASEMWISRNDTTGEIVLRPKRDDRRLRQLRELLKMIESDPLPPDFLPERPVEASRNPLAEWAEAAPAKRRKR